MRIAVLTKSYTSIGKIVYRYWRNCTPVLAKSSIDEFIYRQVLMKSYTSIDENVYQYWHSCIQVLTKSYKCIDKIAVFCWNRILRKQVYDLYTDEGLGQYLYTIWSILVYDYVNTSVQFHQCGYMILPMAVYAFCQCRYSIIECHWYIFGQVWGWNGSIWTRVHNKFNLVMIFYLKKLPSAICQS